MFALAACERDPVEWGDIRYSMSTPVTAVSSTEATEPIGAPLALPDSAACRSTVRVARIGKSFYAAWWSVRPDSSSALELSRSDDGGRWTKPVAADSNDNARRGCIRPAPSISADIISGYVHLAYFLEPASGAGVFSAHTMDRGLSFHSPVPIIFGARPSAIAIAAEGDRVAVAYEDPNSTRSRIFVALSRTMGHIFEIKLPVSEESANAVDPAVKLRGTKLEVNWTERPPFTDSTSSRRASRIGLWK